MGLGEKQKGHLAGGLFFALLELLIFQLDGDAFRDASPSTAESVGEL